MGSRQKFIGPKPKVVVPKASKEDDWLTVPEGHYLLVRTTISDYGISIPAGTKYRMNEKRVEALEFEEDHEMTHSMLVTAPFIARILKEEEGSSEYE